jgi:hypothetical protein
MHQQVRTSPTRTGGPGADAERGGVTEILRILRDAEVNLQTAGGRDLDRKGEFVFAVHHGEDDPDRPGEEAAELLRQNGFTDARTVKARFCDVQDEPGGLHGCIERIEAEEGEPIYEIFVGTPEDDVIPIQLTTRSMVAPPETSA